MTENQERVIEALGLDYRDGDNASKVIEDALQGVSVRDKAFNWLLGALGPKKVMRGTRTEYVPDRCPFCGTTNMGGYVCFTFSDETSYCYKCGGTAGMLDLALAVRNSSLARVGFVRMPNKAPNSDGNTKRRVTQKRRVGQSSVWLQTYQARNLSYRRLSHEDYEEAIFYFTNKGLRRPFVTNRLLPYLDKHHVKFLHAKRNYSGDTGVAIMVPFVSEKGERVRAIKRRICVMLDDTTAPRWNFNIYPKNENLIWSTVKPHLYQYVVMVENQLDAATLQLIADMGEYRGMIAFCAPVTPMAVDMSIAMKECVESDAVEVIVYSYDNDENGAGYCKRDVDATGSKSIGMTGYGDEASGLLDTMIKYKQSIGDLIHFIEEATR